MAPPLAAAVTAGLAVSRYRDSLTITTNTSTASASSPAAQQAEAEAERRRRHREQEAAMEDAYGDRGSLAELERALAVYEAQRRG